MLKINAQKIRDVLAQVRGMQKDPFFKIIVSMDNNAYFKHRAIEAIHQGDYLLACKLLVILLVIGPLGSAGQTQLKQEIKRIKKDNANRS